MCADTAMVSWNKHYFNTCTSLFILHRTITTRVFFVHVIIIQLVVNEFIVPYPARD